MSVQIEVLREATDEAVEAFRRLLPQLSSSATALDHDDLADVLGRTSVPVDMSVRASMVSLQDVVVGNSGARARDRRA